MESSNAYPVLPSWLAGFEFQTLPTPILLTADEILFHQDDKPDHVYLIIDGLLSVSHLSKNGKVLEIEKLFANDLVGELGLLNNQLRMATVKAEVDTKLLQISTADFEQFKFNSNKSANLIVDKLTQRWRRLQLSSILSNLFGEQNKATIDKIQDSLIWHNISADEVLCYQDDPAESMYIIVNGRFQFHTTNESGEQTILGHAERGETIGEYALITNNTRSATIQALRESVIVEMTQEMYQQWSIDFPQINPAITKLIVERQLRKIGHLPSNKTTNLNLTVMPIDPAANITSFVNQLETALSTFGSIKIISAETVNQSLNYADIALVDRNDRLNTAVTQWLSDQETQYDFLIFQPDEHYSMWTQRCIAQSDKVLILAQPTIDENIEPSANERHLLVQNTRLQQELVLWHPASTAQPKNTINWLTSRPHLTKHHHVLDNDNLHFARLARSLVGQSIGVVFSGGAARGHVQFGVLKAMRELNIPVDYIGGTSFGSITAAVSAMNIDEQAIDQMCDKFNRKEYTQDLTYPFIALNKSEGFFNLFRGAFGDIQIEDLWIPYFAVTTNISTASLKVIDRGPLWLATRKSAAIPGIYTPIFENGDIFIDGGIMNNFPIDVMANLLGSKRIIGVTILPENYEKHEYDVGYSISGWKLLFNKLNPFVTTEKMLTIASLLWRAAEVKNVRHNKEYAKLADLMMIISPKNVGFLEFEKYKEVAQVGYDESIDHLIAWKKKQVDLA